MQDYYTDTDKTVWSEIAQRPDLPEFVRHRALSEEDHKRLAPTEFADPSARLYPICSKAETWRSIAYFNAVPHQALLSPASAKEREHIRTMLAKAASLWGLNDDEVQKLSEQVTLHVAEAEAPEIDLPTFLRTADTFEPEQRRQTADLLLKAAETSDTELAEDVRRRLQKYAGAGTCSVLEASCTIRDLLKEVPYRSDARPMLVDIQQSLAHKAEGELLAPRDVDVLEDLIETVAKRYHIRKFAATERLRTFVLEDAKEVGEEVADRVELPGGIMARKAAVSENAKRIGVALHNLHGIDAYSPEEQLTQLQRLTPVELLPFRPLVQ